MSINFDVWILIYHSGKRGVTGCLVTVSPYLNMV